MKVCVWHLCGTFLFSHDLPASMGLCLLCEVPWSHSATPHSVGLLCTSDKPITTHNTHKKQTSMPQVPWSHSATPHSVGLLCMSDKPITTHNTHKKQTSVPQVPCSHSPTPHSVGLLCTSDKPITTHNTHKKQTSMPPAGFQFCHSSKQAPTDPRLRSYGHWDWLLWRLMYYNAMVTYKITENLCGKCGRCLHTLVAAECL